MKNSRTILIPVLIVATIIGLFFGIWGVYQIGWENGLNAKVQQNEQPLNQNPSADPNQYSPDYPRDGYYWNWPWERNFTWHWPMGDRHHWHWPIGGIFLVFICIIILGMIGCYIFMRRWSSGNRSWCMPWCMPWFGWNDRRYSRDWHRRYHCWDNFADKGVDESYSHNHSNRPNPQANHEKNNDKHE